MKKIVLRNNSFYCHHISDDDQEDILSFTSDKSGNNLAKYLQYMAYPDEDNNNMRTYLVRDTDTDKLAAYFSLKVGHIAINEREEYRYGTPRTYFDNIPGIEIANFAINSSYISKYKGSKGCGLIIFRDFIIPLIDTVSKIVGAKIIFIFALPEETLIRNYRERYGFQRLNPADEQKLHNRIKPEYDESCIFMFQLI